MQGSLCYALRAWVGRTVVDGTVVGGTVAVVVVG
jgi:hypothetical protein